MDDAATPHPRPSVARWNPGGELGYALAAAAELLERSDLRPVGTFQLSGMTRPQRAAIGALLGCGMVRPTVLLDLEVLDAILRGKYGLAGGLVEACETALERNLAGSAVSRPGSPGPT